ncbi:MAG: hypothetical protein FJ030_03425 [Chloroflexi bacterium]|nr:hypothetical protein [Chloroflexota bacterium]
MSALPPPAPPSQPEPGLTPEQRRMVFMSLAGLVVIIALMGVAVYFMVKNPAATTVIRDIFIIFMALESLVIGVALIILMIQLARLTNLLQHEIKPILENTNETVNTVRGTAIFVSENLVDPVMKLNGYIAALGKFFELINVVTKK